MKQDIEWFNKHMEYNLARMDLKPMLEDMMVDDILEELKKSVAELQGFVESDAPSVPVFAANIVLEAAKVASLALIISKVTHDDVYPVDPHGETEDE